jgi:hypothetical protein
MSGSSRETLSNQHKTGDFETPLARRIRASDFGVLSAFGFRDSDFIRETALQNHLPQ